MKNFVRVNIFGIILCVMILNSCSSISRSDATLEGVESIPPIPLNVGIAISPPFVCKNDSKQLSGSEIKILRAFSKKNKYEPNYFEFSKEELPFALKRGDVDLIIGDLTQKEIEALFLQPCACHFSLGFRLLISADSAPYINSMSQINNKKITIYTVVDSATTDFSKSFFSNASTVSLASEKKCIGKALQEKGSVMLINSKDTNRIIELSNSKLQPILSFLGSSTIAWGIKKQNTKLLDQINNFMNSYKCTDDFKALIQLKTLKNLIKQ